MLKWHNIPVNVLKTSEKVCYFCIYEKNSLILRRNFIKLGVLASVGMPFAVIDIYISKDSNRYVQTERIRQKQVG